MEHHLHRDYYPLLFMTFGPEHNIMYVKAYKLEGQMATQLGSILRDST